MKIGYTLFALLAVALNPPATGATMAPAQQAYVKASNTRAIDNFGHALAVSGDTMVIGSPREDSNATGVNGNQSDTSAASAGAAYVFVRTGTNWIQQAYFKASNAEAGDLFGWSVAVSGDTVVVGAFWEDSNATGVNGNQSDNSALSAGAAYVFVRTGTNWVQQAYLKASTAGTTEFGASVAMSGNTVILGAANVACVFVRVGTNWCQQASLEASNADPNDFFGRSVAVSSDTAVVGAMQEDSSAAGVNGNENDNGATDSGAAYVFVRTGTNWIQQAYLKASNPRGRLTASPGDQFGTSVAMAGDTILVGAEYEASRATGVNGDQTNNDDFLAGAAYVFARTGTNWSQQAYLKASNTGFGDRFGYRVGIDGETAVVSAYYEQSSASGVNGNQLDNGLNRSGAAYVFLRNGTNWSQQAYLKASNPGLNDRFGNSVAISLNTVAIGAFQEDSNATGVDGNQADNSLTDSGAVYVFTGVGTGPQLAITPDGNGGYFIRFHGLANVGYQFQRAAAVDGPWTTNATITALAPGIIEFHDTNALSGQAFYRAAQQ